MADFTLTQTGQEVQDLLDTIGTSPLSTTAQTLTGAVNELNTLSALANVVYPVGSVLVTQTPTNPSGTYGGTWTLFDKEFRADAGGQDFSNSAVLNTTNTTSLGLYGVRSGHYVYLTGSLVNKVAFAETNLNLTTSINWSDLGFTEPSYRPYFTAHSDGAGAMASFNLTTGGNLKYTEIVIKGGGTSAPAGNTWDFSLILFVHYLKMADSACDKFYWRRTA